MKKYRLGIIILGWIEILTFLTIIITLVKIDYYPMVLLYFPIPVIIIGILTLKFKPIARRLNLLLPPLIVFTYVSGLMMLLESLIFITKGKIETV